MSWFHEMTSVSYMHVFYVRCLIAICQKLKRPLFVGITDFEAAFDKISRRNLFVKLVDLGISAMMLRALVEMYSVTESYVEVNGEYSKLFNMTAGVLQGSATSTVLYMAYTADLVKLFNNKFPIEEIIHLYHILLHADDCLLLSTVRSLFVKKFECLQQYCVDNNISLQPKKCGFLAINTTEVDSIVLENGVINCLNEAVYLGSTITNTGKVSMDVASEIKQRHKQFSRFHAFLRENYNAPLSVKETVLDAGIAAVLHNCESWGDANLDALEVLYKKALKYMLGVRKTVCNEFVYIELAKPSLRSLIWKRQYKFFQNCVRDRDWPLMRHIIRQAMDSKCSFIQHYNKLLEKYNSADKITEESLLTMKDDVKLKASREQSKYVSYLKLNPTLSKPNIYTTYAPTYKVHHTSRIRIISHSLQIELGRQKRPKVPVEERLCRCGYGVETEEHFLRDCNMYTHIRHKYDINQETELSHILDSNITFDYVTELHDCREIYANS